MLQSFRAVLADRGRARARSFLRRVRPKGRCADDKGEFMLGNRQYCYPPSIADYRSRYLLAGAGMASTRSDFAFALSNASSSTENDRVEPATNPFASEKV